MKNLFENYIQSVSSKFSHEETSEMGYRTDFELLIKGIFESIKGVRILHDSRAHKGNKPDFIVLTNDVPILYIEAKDIGVSLDEVEKSEQMERYFGYTNLILTDYVEFRFYRNGLRYEEPIKIAEYDISKRTIVPLQQSYEHAAKTLLEFTQSQKEPIKSGEHLAKIMGGKAQRIRDNVRHFLSSDSVQNTELVHVQEAIKKMLVHDLTVDAFSDMYAQTLVYGLFVARYYDDSPNTFSRQEARDLVPASNPFLQHFFDHIAGPNFDKRLSYIVDELCVVFQHADTKKLIEEYMGDADPVIHFYEDFLKEYDPDLRKKMGAYYTPLPVVNFIIRSVDQILQKDFGLVQGLADTTKLPDGRHRVQILDPAVGTGTFISAVIDTIYNRQLERGQKGGWTSYVHHSLLPRIHGFELMMTPYTIAHLKVSMKLQKTGFKYFNETRSGKARLGVYLTNSLEEAPKQQELLAFDFGAAIAKEAEEASVIKNETPIMVVVGNPPYSGVSSNETKYANSLVEKYKIEPGGKQKLQERKHWLNDDYVKFIAFAEDMVAKNKEGILGFITNHGYLDNPTFRGMRWHLMDTFDSIYVIDLHGNSKKKEIAPDGSKDENVFNIQQGVSIILAIKTGKKKKGDLARIHRTDLWGKRGSKFEQLNNLSIENAKWTILKPRPPNLFFVPEGSIKLEEEYRKGFSVNDILVESTTGIVTMGDGFIVDEDKESLQKRVDNFLSEDISKNVLTEKYGLGKNYAEWIIKNKKSISNNPDKIVPFAYRPFDNRYTYFDNKLAWRPRTKIMSNFLAGDNISLEVCRQVIGSNWAHIFITDKMPDDSYVSNRTRERGYALPLYLCQNDGSKIPNLKQETVNQIEKIVGKTIPEDIFDYIYAVLHSPSYREKYKEFLKIDFPCVPYPKDKKQFKALVALGRELRELHLLESPNVSKFITSYPIAGSDVVEKISYKDGKVFINAEQYFGDVSEVAWSFYIGGYQPAQKWLKDRKGRALTNEDIEHYQKMIVALVETDRIMKEIDLIKL